MLHLDRFQNEGMHFMIQKTFKALSDPTRKEIMDLLREGRKSAGEIAEHFKCSNATISHHLSVLKDAQLLTDEREGKYIYYELNMTVLDELIGWISSFSSGGFQNESQNTVCGAANADSDSPSGSTVL